MEENEEFFQINEIKIKKDVALNFLYECLLAILPDSELKAHAHFLKNTENGIFKYSPETIKNIRFWVEPTLSDSHATREFFEKQVFIDRKKLPIFEINTNNFSKQELENLQNLIF